MTDISRTAVVQAVNLTHLPPSFNGNPVLFAASLTSVMSIACLGIAVCGWMARDNWHDYRHYNLPIFSVQFLFRWMMGLAAFAAFFRSMPEVLYLQTYGDPGVSTEVQAMVITAKRLADTTALLFVSGWMFILIAIYEPICAALQRGEIRNVLITRQATLPRARRPAICFACIVCTAVAFAYAKVYGQ
jgi:hypothetical protein